MRRPGLRAVVVPRRGAWALAGVVPRRGAWALAGGGPMRGRAGTGEVGSAGLTGEGSVGLFARPT